MNINDTRMLRAATPIEFRDLLISMARSVKQPALEAAE
jgi:hypothetical protein